MKILYSIILSLFLLSISIYSEITVRPNRYKILVGGDVMFDWGIKRSIGVLGNSVISTELMEIFEEADYRAVNLETPVVGSPGIKPFQKSYVFKSDPDDLVLLKQLNIDMVFLGNNHSMDYGVAGLKETFHYLEEYGIQYAGSGLNQRDAYKPVGFFPKRTDFQFLSTSQIGPVSLFATGKSPGIAGYNAWMLNNAIKNKKKNEVLLLSVHWGIEYSPEPTSAQVSTAHQLIDSGYSVIIGHHTHIPQGIEKYKNGVIFYSLGNFMFGSRNQYLTHNILAMLHFNKKELEKVEIIPVFGEFQKEDLHTYRPLSNKEADRFLKEYSVLCEKLNTKIEIKNGRGYIQFLNSK